MIARYLIVLVFVSFVFSQPLGYGSSSCDPVSDREREEITDFVAEFMDRQDEIHIRNFIENWNETRYTTNIVELFSRLTEDAEYTILPGTFLNGTDQPPITGITRAVITAVFIAGIRPANGGELRTTDRTFVYCTSVRHFTVFRIGRADTQPLTAGTWDGEMWTIPTKMQFDVVRPFPGSDLKIKKIVSDQRGAYFESTMDSPWATIHVGKYYP